MVLQSAKSQRKKTKEFIDEWEDKGYEKGESQSFWLDLLRNVLGIENPSQYIKFEEEVKLDKTSFIDAYIEQTHVMIEQKGRKKDLNKPIKQSDGTLLTPFQQAKRYSAGLSYSKRPRWIVTCNFKEFYIYDMERPNDDPSVVRLADLEKEYYRLEFLVDKSNEHIEKEMQVSFKAGNIVGEIYDELLKQYADPTNDHSLKSLNQLCVRLVFCFYAEDADLFGRHDMFHDYLAGIETRFWRRSLIDLFKVLDTKIEDRDPYLDKKLAEFPYVNGGMFSDENIEIPQFNNELRNLILNKASMGFDWSKISPTIFGAVFESTLNPETRRSGGMHYTSVENIHKVIDPLFLNNLKNELNEIKKYKQPKIIKEKAKAYQYKLSHLKFLDPACGSGNFLTETYLSLRKLENEAIKLMYGANTMLDTGQNIVKVSIQQFYGIEINDFAVSVAKTALWIAESQMLEETKEIIYTNASFLPLKTYTNIVEGNALKLDWNKVIEPYELDYIMGNPPFVGARLMAKNQKDDLKQIFNKEKGVGNVDYVACWFRKATDYMEKTTIKSALVATNSVTQGEQVAIIWNRLINKGLNIFFAYRTFKWDSEAKLKAHVHVVIIGFTYVKVKNKYLFSELNKVEIVGHINPYLINAPDVFIKSRRMPIATSKIMVFGSMPNDNGFLSKYSVQDVKSLTRENPYIKRFFKKIIGSQEFINDKTRYCIWLKGVSPKQWRNITPIVNAVKKVREYRLKSRRQATKRLAEYPYLFGEIRQPNSDYLVIPRVSSEKRRYIPIGMEDKNVIATDALLIIPNATLYDFGILESNVHMAWMRTVAGRLKSDYRYSAKIVYNNFPWPNLTLKQKERISKTAQQILDARALYPDSSLADLYDETTMPPELRKAHQNNDRAVMEAYGLDVKTTTEAKCVEYLFSLYEKKIKKA